MRTMHESVRLSWFRLPATLLACAQELQQQCFELGVQFGRVRVGF